MQAEATLKWALGEGKVTVGFDPKKSPEVSVTNGPLTVTDPGHLQQAVKRYEKTIADKAARDLALPIRPLPKTTTTTHPIAAPGQPAPAIELSVGTTATVHAPLNTNVVISQSLIWEGDKLILRITASTEFKKTQVQGYGEVSGEYSITAEAEGQPRNKRSQRFSPAFYEDLTTAALLALIAAGGVAIAVRRRP